MESSCEHYCLKKLMVYFGHYYQTGNRKIQEWAFCIFLLAFHLIFLSSVVRIYNSKRVLLIISNTIERFQNLFNFQLIAFSQKVTIILISTLYYCGINSCVILVFLTLLNFSYFIKDLNICQCAL